MNKNGKGIFGAKLELSNNIKKILRKYGKESIVAIRVGRRPINSKVETAFNLISRGKWEKNRAKYFYDVLFHLFIIITLEDGTKISLEKNSIPTMTVNDSRCSEQSVQCKELNYTKNSITLEELVVNPLKRIGKKNYFEYTPFNNNCQKFVGEVLSTFNLYSPEVKEFVYQDITELVKDLPFYVKLIGRTVTDVDATVRKVIGEGVSGGSCGCVGCSVRGKCSKKKIESEEDTKTNDLVELTDYVIGLLN
jgi:hypothetical protein